MKKTNKLIAVALTLCMVIGLFAVTASAEQPKLLILGDSVSAAFGTEKYVENAGGNPLRVLDNEVIEGSYADLVAKALGADATIHAHSGWRVNELLQTAMGKSLEEMEPYSQTMIPILNTITEEQDWVDFAKECEAINRELKEADVISLNFGSNDLFSYPIFTLIASGDIDFNLPKIDFTAIKSINDAIDAISSVITITNDALSLINKIENLVSEGLENFKATYPLLLDYITTNMKPGAKVFVNGAMFPVQLRADITEDFALRIKTKGDKAAAEADEFVRKLCDEYENVYYVNIEKTRNYSIFENFPSLNGLSPEDTIVSVLAFLLKCTHADEKGHAYMADQILDAIKRAETKPEVTADYNLIGQVQLKWNKIDGAVSYVVYRASEIDGSYTRLGTTPAANWIDMTAPAEETLYYKVAASMDISGERLTEKSDAVAFSTENQPSVGRTITELVNAILAAIRNALKTPSIITDIVSQIINGF